VILPEVWIPAPYDHDQRLQANISLLAALLVQAYDPRRVEVYHGRQICKAIQCHDVDNKDEPDTV
jgi:hypothetical protein